VIEHRRPAIERTSTRVLKARNEHTCNHACKKEDRSQLQLSTPVHEDQLNRSPILESFILLGFCKVLVSQRLNPTICRVSRVSLDSINRLINTEKTYVILEKNIWLSRKRFSRFILFFIIILF
jgi:hypothetical protein